MSNFLNKKKSYFCDVDVYDVSEDVIRLACAVHLKILLIVIKRSLKTFTVDDISSALKIDKDDVCDAIKFWLDKNIFKHHEKEFCENLEKKQISNKKIIDKTNIEYVSQRLKSSDEITCLLNEVESILGRPLSGTDVSLFINLKDSEGMPCSVILMLVQYCAKIGKVSTRYIEKVGIDWARSGIDSIESAEEKIKSFNKFQKLWNCFRKIIGTKERAPTAQEEEAIVRWFVLWKYTKYSIKEAYELCIKVKGKYNLSYMDGIIKRWKRDNITSLEEIRDRNKKKTQNQKITSYSIENYESFNIFEV
ncbi:MAG: DnaD domain protein [Firmicutes bacterium]|nr:DnaD domain protein [Bacillota bacterium]